MCVIQWKSLGKFLTFFMKDLLLCFYFSLCESDCLSCWKFSVLPVALHSSLINVKNSFIISSSSHFIHNIRTNPCLCLHNLRLTFHEFVYEIWGINTEEWQQGSVRKFSHTHTHTYAHERFTVHNRVPLGKSMYCCAADSFRFICILNTHARAYGDQFI